MMISISTTYITRGGRTHIRNVTIILSGLTVSILMVFGSQIFTGFNYVFGDSADGLIEVSLVNHWTNVFNGISSWREVEYFYPYRDTLGYNDGYLLYGVLYYIVRFTRLDPLLSISITHILVKTIGFFGMYVLLRSLMKSRVLSSTFGATLFTSSGATIVQATHGQLFTLCFLPWVVWLTMRTVLSIKAREFSRTIKFGSILSILFGAVCLTAFYMVWFLCFFAILYIGLHKLIFKQQLSSALLSGTRELCGSVLVVSLLLLCLIPFALVYAPKALETGMHRYAETMFADPITVFNVGHGNMVWGRLFTSLNSLIFPNNDVAGEDQVGFPPLFLVVSFLLTVRAWQHRNEFIQSIIATMGLTTAICVLSVIHLGHFSLWYIVYHIVPGASGLRAITRMYLFLLLPLCGLIALGIDQ